MVIVPPKLLIPSRLLANQISRFAAALFRRRSASRSCRANDPVDIPAHLSVTERHQARCCAGQLPVDVGEDGRVGDQPSALQQHPDDGRAQLAGAEHRRHQRQPFAQPAGETDLVLGGFVSDVERRGDLHGDSGFRVDGPLVAELVTFVESQCVEIADGGEPGRSMLILTTRCRHHRGGQFGRVNRGGARGGQHLVETRLRRIEHTFDHRWSH
jgi:hypothetical protein